MTHNDAMKLALDVVKAGLQSGSIKLQGSSQYPDNNKLAIRVDSEYLNGLVNAVAANVLEHSVP